MLSRIIAGSVIVSLALMLSSCSQSSQPVETGESGKVVYRDKNGRELTEGELAKASGTVNWSLVGGEDVPPKAEELHAKARKAGSAGKYQVALTLLAQAQKEAPKWPYPVYDAAYTYLLMGDEASALKCYEQTVALSPRGYFTALTAVDCLRKEKAGKLRRGSYRAFLSLERLEEAKKKALLQEIVKAEPRMAPAWEKLAQIIEDDDEKLNALDKGLAAQPDAETKGLLLLNKAALLDRQGKNAEAQKLAGDLALDETAPLDVVMLAKTTMAFLRDKPKPGSQ